MLKVNIHETDNFILSEVMDFSHGGKYYSGPCTKRLRS